MEQFIVRLLATLFDAFKQKNPIVATGIVTVLSAFVLFANTIAPVFGVTSPVVIQILQWLSLLVVGLTSSRTTQILKEAKAEKRQEDLRKE